MRFVVSVVVFCLLVATAAVMAAEPDDEQPYAFAVWERPAVGVFYGVSGNGDQNSRDGSPEVTAVFDTPVVFGWRARADVSRTSWLFGTRNPPSYRLEANDTVTMKSINVSVLRVRHVSPGIAGYAGIGYGSYKYSSGAREIRSPWRGGVHAVAGLEQLLINHRIAFDAEVRIHGIEGPQQPPIVSDTFVKLDAAIGLKLRL